MGIGISMTTSITSGGDPVGMNGTTSQGMFESFDAPDSRTRPRIEPDMSDRWENVATGGLVGLAIAGACSAALGIAGIRAGAAALGGVAALSGAAAIYGAIQLASQD